MKRVIKEQANFENVIRDNPLELLQEVEKQMHVPMRATYPMLILIETIGSLLGIKKGRKESLVNYLERFKSERNVMLTLFGRNMLDVYVENTQKYKDITGTDDENSSCQAEMKEAARERFFAVLFLKGSDQKRFTTNPTEKRTFFCLKKNEN